MNKRFVICLLFSALGHALVIILPSLLPLLFIATEPIGLTSDSSEGTVMDVEDSNFDQNKDETKKLILSNTSLNIDVVPRELIKSKFNEETAEELIQLFKIKDKEEKINAEETSKEKEQEFTDAISGKNIINTYPLQQHADVILENFDFTQPFQAEIEFSINSDGSFRNITLGQETGIRAVDKSLENIFYELGSQKVALFTNFRRMHSLIYSEDGKSLTFELTAFFKDSVTALSIYTLLSTLVNYTKSNNKNDIETTTLLNNLNMELDSNSLKITINSDMLFVKEAIKD